jgi:hypothetical protein
MRLTHLHDAIRRRMRGTLPATDAVGSNASGRAPWLLLFNCQGMGLANSLNLLCSTIHVEHYDPAGFTRNRAEVTARLAEFERILVAPQVERSLGLELDGLDTVWRVPTITFDAYHPDICYLLQSGKSLKGPMGDYHSLVAYAAFSNGLDESRTVALFNERMYAALGYFERWDAARERLLTLFQSHGFDIASRYPHWSRNGAFMYSFNHVRIHCLRDVATSILERAGLPVEATDLLPHDNLANGPIFPIYPEIAARLGTPGNYLFKPGGRYELIGLEQFVAASFALYRAAKGVTVRPEYARALAGARATIEAIP